MTDGPLVGIVDDDDGFRESLDGFLRSVGFRVHAFASPAEFMTHGLDLGAAFMLLDVTLPGMSGPEFLRELRHRGVATPAVFLSGRHDEALVREGLAAGAVGFLVKPFDEDELLALLRPTG